MRGREDKPLQKEILLQVMATPSARKNGVTVVEIMMNTGIGDPRARFRDLEEDGYVILKTWETKKYPNRRPSRYKRYFLISEVAHG